MKRHTRTRTMAELELDIAEATLDKRAEITHHFVSGGDAERAYTMAVGTVRAARELVAAQTARQIEQIRNRRAA